MEYGDELHGHEPRELVCDKKCNISRMARAQNYYYSGRQLHIVTMR